MIGMVSAEPCTNEIPPVKQGNSIQLTQICDNCTYVNITQIVFPNQTFAFQGQASTTKNDINFNYTFSNTQTIGRYWYTTKGDLNGVTTGQSICFDVTPTGNILSTGASMIYTVLLVILIILNIFNFYIIATLDVRNATKDGEVVGITLIKYVRIILIGLSYGLILLTLNLMNALALASSQVTQFSGIIGGLFDIMIRMAWVWTLIIVIWIFVSIWKDNQLVKEIRKRLEQGEWFDE